MNNTISFRSILHWRRVLPFLPAFRTCTKTLKSSWSDQDTWSTALEAPIKVVVLLWIKFTSSASASIWSTGTSDWYENVPYSPVLGGFHEDFHNSACTGAGIWCLVSAIPRRMHMGADTGWSVVQRYGFWAFSATYSQYFCDKPGKPLEIFDWFVDI